MTWRVRLRPCLAAAVRSAPRSVRAINTFNGRETPVRCSQLLSNDTNSYEGKEILISGTVRTVRKQKRNAFLHISDGSSSQPVQAVLTPEQADSLTMGTSIKISGTWAPSLGKGQTHELKTEVVKVLGQSDPENFPLQKKYQTSEFLRTIPHLRLRTPLNALLARFRSECLFGLAQYFRDHKNGAIVQVQPPVITSSDCEGAGEVFTISPRDQDAGAPKAQTELFFREPKYLTVSTQLHLEAYAAELGSVWTLSPTFRAEKSDTPRHLSEFYMLEVEINFVEKLEELMSFTEDLLRHMVDLTQSTVGDELLYLRKAAEANGETEQSLDLQSRWKDLSRKSPWPRVSYTEAMQLLLDASSEHLVSFKYKPSWTTGLQLEHEKYLVESIGQGAPVFITDYPEAIKPFYMSPSSSTTNNLPTDPTRSTVACFDLLLPEVCEVVGGSLREHRLEHLIQNMREHNLLRARSTPTSPTDSSGEAYPYLHPNEDLGALKWYADLRRYGSSPHGGFGLGFDRLLCFLTGVSNVRDMVPFPRYFGRADC